MGSFLGGDTKLETEALFQPQSAPALNLLGIGQFAPSGERGLKLVGNPTANVFGTENLNTLSEFLQTPPEPTALQVLARESGAERVGDLSSISKGFLAQDLLPAVDELLRTGFRTNTEGIRRGALREFERTTVPTALERVGSEFGLASTATRDALLQEAADLENALAELDFEASEAAAGRRAAGTAAAGDIIGGALENILGLEAGQLEFGQALQEDIQAGTQGSRLLNSLLVLLGSTPSTGFASTAAVEPPSDLARILQGVSSGLNISASLPSGGGGGG